jgi:hypothetical protein
MTYTRTYLYRTYGINNRSDKEEAQQFEERPADSAEEREINYWVFGLCPSSGILKTRPPL